MADPIPPSENGVPLVPDPNNGKRGPGQPSKVDAIDPEAVIECIHKHNGIMYLVLEELKISYPTFLKIRRKHKRVERAFWFAHHRLRPEYARHLVYKHAKNDPKTAMWLAGRVCSELKPVPKVLRVGVGQDPNASPVQHQHRVGILNLDSIFDKLTVEDQQLIIEHIKSQGLESTPLEHQAKLEDKNDKFEK